MGAWYLATAAILAPSLVEPGEEIGFATRERARAEVAPSLGLRTLWRGMKMTSHGGYRARPVEFELRFESTWNSCTCSVATPRVPSHS